MRNLIILILVLFASCKEPILCKVCTETREVKTNGSVLSITDLGELCDEELVIEGTRTEQMGQATILVTTSCE